MLMAQEAPGANMVCFTGDFCEAGAVDACDAEQRPTHRQILDIMATLIGDRSEPCCPGPRCSAAWVV